LVRSRPHDEIFREAKAAPDAAQPERDPQALARDLEAMGPTFIKLGQVLSSRPDFLPAAEVAALARLQDDVAPFPFADVEAVIQDELGVRLSKAFLEFDPQPVASASLGQVHRAVLRDGRVVAVKVQRPGVRATIGADLDALGNLAGLVDRTTETGRRLRFVELLEDVRSNLAQELDYRREAANLVTLRENLAGFPELVIPAPVDDYTTSRVLTMDWVDGTKVTALGPLPKLDLDGPELATLLLRAYLEQVLRNGFFHADPHPGNVFVTRDRRLALIDLGSVGRVSEDLRDRLLRLLLSLSEGRGEEVAEQMLAMSVREKASDEEGFRRRVATLAADWTSAPGAQSDMGSLVAELVRAATDCWIRPPRELALLGKTLLQLDGIAQALAPGFSANAAIREHLASLATQRMWAEFSPARLLSTVYEARDLLRKLPSAMGSILEQLRRGELTVHVDAIDEELLTSSLQKIANRITVGLVLAALILGAALLMSVPTDFRILGYPGLAMVFFLGAAVGGVMLVAQILWSDRSPRGPRAKHRRGHR
jgi:ubiquinone biosynthesis protein